MRARSVFAIGSISGVRWWMMVSQSWNLRRGAIPSLPVRHGIGSVQLFAAFQNFETALRNCDMDYFRVTCWFGLLDDWTTQQMRHGHDYLALQSRRCTGSQTWLSLVRTGVHHWVGIVICRPLNEAPLSLRWHFLGQCQRQCLGLESLVFFNLWWMTVGCGCRVGGSQTTASLLLSRLDWAGSPD